MDAMVATDTKVGSKARPPTAPATEKAWHGCDIGPQEGPQDQFLKTKADIAIFGGSVGGGKSWALLIEPLRNIDVPGFGAVIFRRESTQIRAEGGLWDMSMELYPRFLGIPRESPSLDWRFPSGARIQFAHMQHESDRLSWDSTQIALICFDQLESFSWKQFIYMLSRNRSMCGVSPYIRATCNPNPDHYLRQFLAWWIDKDTGYAIPEHSGVIRWFVNVNNEDHWAGTPEELKTQFGDDCDPKSCTFIRSSIYDNQILLKMNPGYIATLKKLPLIDRERLLEGNWNVRESAGMFFQRAWFEIVEAAPADADRIRYWDRAATDAAVAKGRGSYTAGVRMSKSRSTGMFYIEDVERFQRSPLGVRDTIKNVATQDGVAIRIGIEQDPGQAGKAEAQDQARNLAGFDVTINVVRETKAKRAGVGIDVDHTGGLRARSFSAQAEAGNVKLVRGAWNEDYLRELQNFDGSANCTSDQVDASSGAFHLLTNVKRAGIWGKK